MAQVTERGEDSASVASIQLVDVPGSKAPAQIFISYSRRDKEFVQAFDRELRAREIKTWVDWEDIPLGAPWRDEIAAAIEGAQGFLFFLSDSSVASPECSKEVIHAEENNKRILPIARTDMDPQSVPPNLRDRNWLCMRGQDDLRRAVDNVLQWLTTDPEHVKQHTQFLVRAKEWEHLHLDGSLLMRGSELQAAENWLAGAQGKDPAPTDLHTRYILASRKAEIGRQRRLTGGAIAAFIVCAILALMAWREKGIALQQRSEAVQAQGMERADELTLGALQRLQRDPDSSIGIAADAVASSYKEGNIAAENRAVSALRQVLATSHARAILRAHSKNVETAAFDPRGDEVVTAGDDGFAYLWHWSASTSRHTALRFQSDWPLSDAAISPDNRHVLTASMDGTARLWDLTTGRDTILQSRPGSGYTDLNGVNTAAFSPDGRYVVTGGTDDVLRVWDAQTGRKLRELAGTKSADAIAAASFSPNSNEIVATTNEGRATVWTWKTARRWEDLPGAGHAYSYTAVFSPDGTYVATASDDGAARVWNWKARRLLSTFRQDDMVMRVVSFNPRDPFTIVTGSNDGRAYLWHWRSGTSEMLKPSPNALFTDRGRVHTAAFSADGKYVLTGGNDDMVRVWDARSGRELRELQGPPGNLISVAAFSPDGKEVVAATRTGRATVWRWTEGGQWHELPHTGNQFVITVQFSADRAGTYVVTAADDGIARVWNWRTGTIRQLRDHSAYTNAGGVYAASFSPDGKHILTAGYDDYVRVWDARSGAGLQELPGLRPSVDTIPTATFSPDGREILAVTNHGGTTVWNWESGSSWSDLPGTGHVDVYGAAFSHDGQYVATSDKDGIVRVWNWRAKHLEGEFGIASEHQGAHGKQYNGQVARAVNFDPADDHTVVIGSDDGRAFVWNWQSGSKAVLTYSSKFTHAGGVNAAVFSPNGKLIATAGADNMARIWDARTRELKFVLSGHQAPVYTAAFNRDGNFLVTAGYDMTARVWDVHTGQAIAILRGHTDSVNSAVFVDGQTGMNVVTASADDTVRVWNVGVDEGRALNDGAGLTAAAFRPDGRNVVTVDVNNHVCLWNIGTGRCTRHMNLPGTSYDATFSPDRRYLISADEKDQGMGSLVLSAWPARGKPIILRTPSEVMGAAMSYDDRYLVTASKDGIARLYDWRRCHTKCVPDLSLIPVRPNQSGKIVGETVLEDAAFSPNGRHLVTVGDNGVTRVWEIHACGKHLCTQGMAASWRQGAKLWWASFSPDGRYVVTSGDRSIARVWDWRSMQGNYPLEGHVGTVYTSSFSPTGSLVLTTGEDHTARVWDAQTSQPLAQLMGGTQDAGYAAFSPDGRWIVAADNDGKARVYRCEVCGPLPDLLKLARARMRLTGTTGQ